MSDKMGLRITAMTIDLNELKDSQFRDTVGKLMNGYYAYNNEDALSNFLRNHYAQFAGKNAGICYMSDSYDSEKVSGRDRSLQRFIKTMKNGHHSVADHCKVTMLIQNVPKIFAMIMNSFRDYATSEKSARYTIMDNLSEDESKLYDKWRKNLKDVLVLEKNVYEKQAEKIANENARYFISIFSPSTTFSYTTSVRQWNYINQWFKELVSANLTKEGENVEYGSTTFYSQLKPWLLEFSKIFESTFVYDELIKEPKGRRIEFIPQLYPDTLSPIYEKEYYRDSYCAKYEVSFTSLAQLHRHRTIQYIINDLRLDKEPLFFIPDFISSSRKYVKEWLADMQSVKDRFPQGLCIEVVELGTIGNFLLKCDERLCGRAQFETMKNVSDVLVRFHKDGYLSSYFKEQVSNWVEFKEYDDSIRVKSKCEMRAFGCAEDDKCIHGPHGATTREF